MGADLNHPTRERLVSATARLLGELPSEDVTATLVLRETGLSRGSLYHFFADFNELLEAAYVRRFATTVSASILAIRSIVDESANRAEFLQRLTEVTRITQDPARAASRFERARALARTETSARFRHSLGAVQRELTDALTECFADAQAKGLLNSDFSPRAGAVLIQAYTLGRIVDEITDNPVDPDEWTALIGLIADRALS